MKKIENLTHNQYIHKLPNGDFLAMIQKKCLENENKYCLIDVNSNESLTCGDLFKKSHLIAQHLMKLGFQKGETMGFYCENCIEFILVEFAVLQLGGRFAGIMPHLKERELKRVIELGKCGYLFTNKNLVSNAIAVADDLNIKGIICLDEYEGSSCISYQSLLLNERDLPYLSTSASLLCAEDAPIYIVFSSGTTGPSKAVAWSPSNLLRSALVTKLSGLMVPPGINFLPFTNGIGVLSVLCHLLHGEQLVFMKSFDVNLYIESVIKYQVESLTLVPSVISTILNHPSIGTSDLSSVRVVSSTGSPLSAQMETLICQKFKLPEDCFIQTFGMTEGATFTGVVPRWLIDKSSSEIYPKPPGSVGQVVPETQGRIADLNNGESLGPCQAGELLFKGKQIMVGYVNDTEATSQIIDSEGWMHTGDIAHYDENGFIYIVDRIKDVIKCHAFQVSPSELEAAIMSKEGVADCTVVGVPDEEAGEAPIAFVVLEQNMHLSADNIKEVVTDKLASFKRLKDVKFVEYIPKTVTGKPLRRLLKEHL